MKEQLEFIKLCWGWMRRSECLWFKEEQKNVCHRSPDQAGWWYPQQTEKNNLTFAGPDHHFDYPVICWRENSETGVSRPQRLDKWAERNVMKEKCEVLHLRRNNSKYHYMLGGTQLKNSLAENYPCKGSLKWWTRTSRLWGKSERVGNIQNREEKAQRGVCVWGAENWTKHSRSDLNRKKSYRKDCFPQISGCTLHNTVQEADKLPYWQEIISEKCLTHQDPQVHFCKTPRLALPT